MSNQLINKRIRAVRNVVIVLGTVLLMLAVGSYVFGQKYQGRVFPNITVGNIQLGGMDLTEADKLVEQSVVEAKDKKLTLVTTDFSSTYALPVLGVQLDEKNTLKQLHEFGRSQNMFINLGERIRSLLGSVYIPVSSNNSGELESNISQLANKINRSPKEADLIIDKQQVQIKEAVEGRKTDIHQLQITINERIAVLDFRPIVVPVNISSPQISTELATAVSEQIANSLKEPYELTFRDKVFNLTSNDLWSWLVVNPVNNNFKVGLDENKLNTYFKNLALQIDQPMQNAVFKMAEDNVVEFKPDKSGAVLKVKEAVSLINKTLLTDQRKFAVPINALEPTVKLSSLNSLGINELVAEGESNFAGSPKNRRHNIAIGMRRFDLMLIPPQSTFSFDVALGEVTAGTGYLPEMVIKGDETIPEYGGGLCQVSTTAFRAILDGGYPVVERRAHAYRVGYYEPAGSDATIYPPSPDLKFTNDSPGYILVSTAINGNNAYFKFYGTKMNRKVTLEGPVIFNITDYPEPIYIETSTLPVGEVKRIDSAHRGADAILYRYIYDDEDKLIRKDTFKSHYVPWPAKYLVGVPEAPALETDLKNINPDETIPE
ncbi:VanW family protein [Patescibacteria group bacterium]|nr:VanW family protein [Patescibacteria group bacterium]